MVGIIDCCVYLCCLFFFLVAIILSILFSGYAYKILVYTANKHGEVEPLSLLSVVEDNLDYDAQLSLLITGIWLLGFMMIVCFCCIFVNMIRFQLARSCRGFYECCTNCFTPPDSAIIKDPYYHESRRAIEMNKILDRERSDTV